jgi:hypothetical protein
MDSGGPLLAPLAPEPPQPRRRRWSRVALFTGAAVAAVALLLFAVSGTRAAARALDPDSSGSNGTRALAEVLRSQGVRVDVVRTIDEFEATAVDPSTTVVVGDPAYLGAGAAERTTAHAAGARRLVVVEPDDISLQDLDLLLHVTGGSTTDLRAGCTTDLADPSDVVSAPATLYAAGDPAPAGLASCYAPAPAASGASGSDGTGDETGAAVVVLPAAGTTPETVVLGSGAALTNARITDGAQAALALRTLGAVDRLVWYVPDVSDLAAAGPGGQPVDNPNRGVPEWFGPGVLLVGLVVVAYALARGRRLGRLVAEPLPVVVRAVETTEARGRLYHRASDRPLAARTLRAGTRTRLVARLGLPPGSSDAGLVAAVARSTGLPPTDVEALLDGPDPDTDRDLLLLAQRLADLEESVRPA